MHVNDTDLSNELAGMIGFRCCKASMKRRVTKKKSRRATEIGFKIKCASNQSGAANDLLIG